MAGGLSAARSESVNWAEKYIERLSRDMEEIRGMETRLSTKIDTVNNNLSQRIDTVNNRLTERINNVDANLTERIDANNKHIQNIAIAMIIGLGAMTIAITIALRF